MDSQLTTRQIAEALQVSESSVKRWCDRGLIPMVRTAGGHRRVLMSAFMNYVTETQQPVAVNRLPVECRKSLIPKETEPECVEELQASFRDGLMSGDEKRVHDAMRRYFQCRECVASFADEVIAKSFHQIGEQWCRGEVEIYQERRAADICGRMLQEIRRLLPEPNANAPQAMGGTIEGDLYQLPTQLIALVFRQNGWRSMNLGANLPLNTIAAAVAQHTPKLLWLSISHIECEERFQQDYQEFYEALPSEMSVVIGGRALHDGLRPQMRYTGFCDDLRQLSSLANAISGVRSAVKSV